MLKIFKYLGHAKGMVLAILLLLVVQAGCDLTLPQYTSEIVDVGIQQGGIEHAAPKRIQKATYEDIQLFMDENEIEQVIPHYIEDTDGTYHLDTEDPDLLAEIDQAIAMPLSILDELRHSDSVDIQQLKQGLVMGQITKDQLLEERQKVEASFGDMSESIIGQKAIEAVKDEYEALNMDPAKIQSDYLRNKGIRMIGLSFLMLMATALIAFFASKVAAGVGRNLRGRLFNKVVSFSQAEMDQFSTASLITRSTNDIQQIQTVEVVLLRMVFYAPIIGIGGILKVMHTKTGMSWIIVVAVALSISIVTVLMSLALPKFKKMQELVDRLNLVSREILTGVPVIRAFSREKFEEKRFEEANRNLMKTQMFTNRVMTFMMPAMMLIMNGVTVLIVWRGGYGIDQGNLQVGDMMAFITYTMQIVMAFLMITMVSIMLPRAGVAANRIEEVLKTEPSIKDAETVKDADIEEGEGCITFDHVCFRYPGAEEDALSDINFTTKPGQTTAIIGSTGAGKSTLLHLIPRFYDVTSGAIRIDGVDIRDLSLKKVRSLLGFVPQKAVLFSGTIESNLKFGGEWIQDTDMEEAAHIAQATEFIDKKSKGYKSAIAQGGTNVSGGQKQRLSIARAIAKKPKIFLFDDSFSALDYKTDAVLRQSLKEHAARANVIIVAQRISTILHADQIIVLEEGGIAGIGRHEELLKTCEAYQEIAKSQLSESELKGGLAE